MILKKIANMRKYERFFSKRLFHNYQAGGLTNFQEGVYLMMDLSFLFDQKENFQGILLKTK